MTFIISFTAETHTDLVLQVRSWLFEAAPAMLSPATGRVSPDLEAVQQMAFRRGYEAALTQREQPATRWSDEEAAQMRESCAEHARGPAPGDYPQAAQAIPVVTESHSDAAGEKLQAAINRIERKKW